ncbi:DUF1861 family protein [Halobacillus salinarum]|uniref:DUF1861 family protein n=1 Tax=Halobacillus salinarum TaxID=2932257 RepID=A0ABY4EMB9_9BACI|nr:DUF1861 family protein [Halobacillus salinarum]UOQ45003.1 DUF1861 family protein [Halobacillus salinarum]
MYRVESLLTEYRANRLVKEAEKLIFAGVGKRDVYNITAPFEDNGKRIIAGRVEARDSENSEVVFFSEQNGEWRPEPGLPTYSLQDPFVSKIHDELVFGGVEIFPHPTNEGALSWRTVFYKGDGLSGLTRFASGPDGMKDIRLVELEDKSIGVFTRPQGEKGGRGKMGYTSISQLEELQAETIAEAPLIESHFADEEWGGANEVRLLKNNEIGVLGHMAAFDEAGNRHYYPIVFQYDPVHNQISHMKIIACRDDFPEGEAKRPDLTDVLFSGGIERLNNQEAALYVGASDAEAYRAVIFDPFVSLEQQNSLFRRGM